MAGQRTWTTAYATRSPRRVAYQMNRRNAAYAAAGRSSDHAAAASATRLNGWRASQSKVCRDDEWSGYLTPGVKLRGSMRSQAARLLRYDRLS